MEAIDDVDYWRSKALEQQARAANAEAQLAGLALQENTDELYAKYRLTKNVDRLEERDGKIMIVRAAPAAALEAVK